MVLLQLRGHMRATELLHLTYDFENLEKLQENQHKFKDYLTERVDKEYGLNNDKFTYYNYMKLKSDSSKCEVIEKNKSIGKGIITFRLDNKNVAMGRRFIMKYKFGLFKITEARYYEIVGEM